MKEQIKTPEKELNKGEINNLSDAGFKTLVIRILQELSEDLNSIKKIQSVTKDTLIKIQNNLQGNNSRVDEAENQINDLEHKEAKNNQSEQQEEKKNPKKRGSVSSGMISSDPTFASQGCQKEKRKSKKLEIYLEKKNERPILEKNSYASPGSKESQTRRMQRGPLQDTP